MTACGGKDIAVDTGGEKVGKYSTSQGIQPRMRDWEKDKHTAATQPKLTDVAKAKNNL